MHRAYAAGKILININRKNQKGYINGAKPFFFFFFGAKQVFPLVDLAALLLRTIKKSKLQQNKT